MLSERHVKVGLKILGYGLILSVSCDTDNFDERPGRTLQSKDAAQRIFMGPESSGHGFVHDSDRGRGVVIGFDETAAAKDRHPHRTEVAGIDRVVQEGRGL